MYIISGRLKRRKLKAPKGIRPTQQKVRKALFDILGDIKGRVFLELFAGSGAVGLEALSQGARRLILVEANRDCTEKIKENLAAINGLPLTTVRIIRKNALAALRQFHLKKEKFDIIFLDPPYYRYSASRQMRRVKALTRSSSTINFDESLSKKTLKSINAYDILSDNAFVICQHFKKDLLPQAIGNLRLLRQAVYGDTFLSFYKKEAENG